uniref:structural maintenance of chromosomes protein 6-like n=1 Tax=Pristiophorus japonicus TaxID=55135 RepID=UPI00398F0083
MSKRTKDLCEGTIPTKKMNTGSMEEFDTKEASRRNEKTATSQNEEDLNSPWNTSEVGIIESISLKNFMCHACLGPITFGPHLNFVIGNNGSGKSAVLTALIIGLGGKATATNRGYSTKGFVRNGQSSARISITLRNRGLDAFKPKLYGKTITVEQLISGQGTRQYRLKSKSGRIISTKKAELNMILDQFNIEVDNPVSILKQEMSKLLLQSKSGADKYKFFMKATQLEQMREDYSQIMQMKTITKDKIQKQDEGLLELKRKVKEKESHYKRLASLNELQEKLEQLKNQMAWALVIEIEKDLQSIKDYLKEEESYSVKYNQDIEEWQAKMNYADLKFKAIQDQLQKIIEEKEHSQRQHFTFKEDMQRKKKTCKESEAPFHRCKSQLKQFEIDHDQLQRRLEELNSVSQSSKADLTERRERIGSLQDQLKALQDQEATTLQQIDDCYRAINNSKDDQDMLRKEEQSLKNLVQSRKRQIDELKANRMDWLKRFDGNMPSLLHAIEETHKQGRFWKKPVGPLGACFKLKYPELALAVESCLKGLLLSFCCDNYRDEQVLQTLMSQYFNSGKRPQINVCEFANQVYNVKGRAVHHPDFPTVLDSLEINNPVVANCLIDMRGIEKILLINNNNRAREIIQQQRPPLNCREAFTAAGDQVFTNRYYSSEVDRARYLGADVESQISQLEVEVNENMVQMLCYQQQLQSIEKGIQRNHTHINNKQIQRRQIQKRITEIMLEMTDLESIEETQAVDISTLKEEAQDIRHRIESAKNELEQARKDMDEHRRIVDEAEQKYKEIEEKERSLAEEADSIKEEQIKVGTEVEKYKCYKRHSEAEKKKHLDGIEKLKERRENKEKILERDIAKARQICSPRLEVTRTPKSIDAEINRLRDRINTEQERHGNKEEITRQYSEALEMYKDVRNQIKNLKKFMQLIDKIMETRQKAYEKFRRYISLRCKYYFISLLSQQHYLGNINFDHKNRDLSISVQREDGIKTAAGDMRSLSGGERSFSTVCFILSLWDTMESPFRCLDEFDVYMDMVNRRISIDLMLKVAERESSRQFLFFTPLNMSFLPDSCLIRILRMHGPERGQATLPFGSQDESEDSDD